MTQLLALGTLDITSEIRSSAESSAPRSVGNDAPLQLALGRMASCHALPSTPTSSSSSSSASSISGSTPLSPETSRFTWGRPQVLVYCLVQCVLYGCQGINYPETYEASKFLVGGYLLLLLSRELLARMAE